ncbi:MAG TPA: polyphosphate polymerase domain-containing protein [Candidatus Corynebacterium avicola]|uniref:Polyphosphate polymerase domain-containing protein n=1 Tax=Candidatus Corynebacterium avicola TaxID=2838527 RepID=A0A9D1RQ68_9CORY|nr:polyphosphate polymerase domain-containing protein [Candidatus Corynebacterium avicola]
MQTVTLDQLNSEAAMLTRIDRKYVLPATDLPEVLDRLDTEAAATRVLQIDGRTAHGYRSVYFDTPDLRSFRMAAHPRRYKFKLRTRTYLDSGESFLEFKAAGPRGVTAKSRFELTGADATAAHDDRLSPDAVAWADDLLDQVRPDHGSPVHADELTPVMWGTYHRTTYLLPDGEGRSTVDTDLTWKGVDTDRLERPGMVIVETKSGNRPSTMDRLLWRSGHRPTKISKFGTGMAALHPELPHNRWTRVLNTYF